VASQEVRRRVRGEESPGRWGEGGSISALAADVQVVVVAGYEVEEGGQGLMEKVSSTHRTEDTLMESFHNVKDLEVDMLAAGEDSYEDEDREPSREGRAVLLVGRWIDRRVLSPVVVILVDSNKVDTVLKDQA